MITGITTKILASIQDFWGLWSKYGVDFENNSEGFPAQTCYWIPMDLQNPLFVKVASCSNKKPRLVPQCAHISYKHVQKSMVVYGPKNRPIPRFFPTSLNRYHNKNEHSQVKKLQWSYLQLGVSPSAIWFWVSPCQRGSCSRASRCKPQYRHRWQAPCPPAVWNQGTLQMKKCRRAFPGHRHQIQGTAKILCIEPAQGKANAIALVIRERMSSGSIISYLWCHSNKWLQELVLGASVNMKCISMKCGVFI